MLIKYILRKIFPVTLYVKVSKNKFEISNIQTKQFLEVFPDESFTTKRLLIGEFLIAEQCLRDAFNKITNKWFIFIGPSVVIHPQEMIEGGIFPIENRVFLEVAYGAGASKVKVWLGNELSDGEVIDYLASKED